MLLQPFSKTDSDGQFQFSYNSGSDVLKQVVTIPAWQYLNVSSDVNGNVTADNNGSYSYDIKNNMVGASTANGTGSYTFNALKQRVTKTVNGVTTYYVYNENSQLVGEYDSNRNVIAEHVYYGSRPVGVYKNGQLYTVHTDYLGTPRVITDSSNNTVWQWLNLNVFGSNLPSVSTIEYNLRFAGQYFDKESNLHYNINRTYNPKTGRYMQSDPLGLAAGPNTYNYVNGNPLNAIDPLGLKTVGIENCEALLKLVDEESKITWPILLTTKYNMFSFSEDVLNLNASFDSIGGKVDLDWMIRSSFPVPKVGGAGYYIGKPAWNIINMFPATSKSIANGKWNIGNYNPFRNMNEEGHRNAPAAAAYYWSNPNVKISDMFAPAIKECKCMLEKR